MKLNGNIPNINLGLTTGVIVLLAFAVIVGGYYINETKNTADENKRLVQLQHEKLSKFIENWEKRLIISNKAGNLTQHRLVSLAENLTNITSLTNEQEVQLLNLSHTNDEIIKQQLLNEEHIQGNLTVHRTEVEALNKNILGNLSDHRVITNMSNDEQLTQSQENNKLLQQIANALNITNTTVPQTQNNTNNNEAIQKILNLLNNTK